MSVHARDLKGARYALWKNPENLTDRQQAKLAWVAKVNHQLFRAYLLKEQLREVFGLKGEEGKQLLDSWLGWARRCRIPSFIELARRISKHREAIDAALDHRLSNGLVESTNTKIRLLTRIAFGFKNPRSHDRPGDAQPRRLLPTPPRPSSRLNRPTEPAGEPEMFGDRDASDVQHSRRSSQHEVGPSLPNRPIGERRW